MEANVGAAGAQKNDADMSPKEKAFMLLAQGKRHYLVKDYFEAVGCLATACELLAEVYGETANECGDAYFSYGKALLGLAREENGVLGDAVEERDEEEEENEQEESETGAEDNEKFDSGKQETEEKIEIEEGVKGNTSFREKEAVAEGDSAEGDGDKDDDNTETVSNLKLAWEMLEIVKIIFQRQADNDQNINLKLAEVYMYLGEIGLESENYSSAIEDINKCLEIRKKLLEKDDRCIAETLYQLGLAHSLASNFDESIKYFSEAVAVLEERIKNLERKKESGSELTESKSDAFYTVDGEIAEIKNLLPEIKDKIVDMKDFRNETLKAMFEKRCEVQQGMSSHGDTPAAAASSSSSSSSSSTSNPKPVSDITHLVRKKRKLDSDMSDIERSKKEPE